MLEILIPFITIGIAELGDKSQLAVCYLAARTKDYMQLLLGVILAFIITDGMAILLGDLIGALVPRLYLQVISGTMFIMFGILSLMQLENGSTASTLKHPFLAGFGIILLSEMGDKTQIAAGLFATTYNPLLVFIGVTSALILLSFIAVFVGAQILKKIDRKIVSRVAGSIFIALGLMTFFLP